jgi:hypothetical protein
MMIAKTSIDWVEVHRRLAENEARLRLALEPSPERARTILAQRAAAVRDFAPPPSDTARHSLIVGKWMNDRFAFPLASVAGVIPLRKVTPVRGAPAGVLGIVHRGGELYTLLDPRRGAAEPRDASTPFSYGLILRHESFRVILAFDAMEGIVPAPKLDPTVDDGIFSHGGKWIQLIETDLYWQHLRSTPSLDLPKTS